MSGGSVLAIEAVDGVQILTINRPEKRNALNAAVRTAVSEALAESAADPAVRVVVFTGAGDQAFVAGADVSEFARRTPIEQREAMRAGLFDDVWSFPKPTIAMINGYCLGGGCELALACDLRIGADSAQLGQPEVRLGLIPGFGGTVRLPRAVGLSMAKELIFTGRRIDAATAERAGLIARRFPDRAAMLEGARATIAEVAENAWTAVALAKRVLVEATGRPTQHASDLEVAGFEDAFRTEDMREGVAAFLEKREPGFSGR